jgi:hypothetical protein
MNAGSHSTKLPGKAGAKINAAPRGAARMRVNAPAFLRSYLCFVFGRRRYSVVAATAEAGA